MTTYYSVGTGFWGNNSTWSLTSGGSGGAGHPISGDTAIIEGGFTVTNDVVRAARRVRISGGILALNADIVMDDATNNYLEIYASAGTGLTTDAWSGVKIRSAANDPTYPWLPFIYDTTIARTLDLDYILFEGAAWFLGNNSGWIYFNGPSYPAKITNVVPPFRTPRLEFHQIDGRDTPRIYNNGGDAGVITIEGYFPWGGGYEKSFNIIADLQRTIAFTSQYIHMPRGHIESIRYRPKGLYVYFSAVLVEDPL